VAAVMEYEFMGGSMGSVVGEKITRAAELALAERRPLLTSAPRGAPDAGGRALADADGQDLRRAGPLHEARIPFISILADPTTGGVTASYAMLGDVIIAEPGALIGFAAPRDRADHPPEAPRGVPALGVLMDHGMLDLVVPRGEMRDTVGRVLRLLWVRPWALRRRPWPRPPPSDDLQPPDELLDWLYGLKGPTLKWDLETAHALNALCGRPDRTFRALHVAGTNARVRWRDGPRDRAGRRIPRALHSPHLVRPEDGSASAPWRSRAGALRADRAAAGARRDGVLSRAAALPSFFEMMTAAAFLSFAEERVRFAAVECGWGTARRHQRDHPPGRGRDHGRDGPRADPRADPRRHRAREGRIVKPGSRSWWGGCRRKRWLRSRRALAASARRSSPRRASWRSERTARPDRFVVATPERTYRGLTCALPGAHQRRNAALAIRAIELCASADSRCRRRRSRRGWRACAGPAGWSGSSGRGSRACCWTRLTTPRGRRRSRRGSRRRRAGARSAGGASRSSA